MARMRLKRSRDFETSLLSFGKAAPRRVRLRCPFPSRCVVALRRLFLPRRAAPVARDRTSCALGGAPFQMKQIIPFRLHIDRAKWDFLLHLEYRDGERVRSPERVTKKVPTEVETSDVTSGGDEGNRTPDLLTASQALSQLSYAPKQQKRTIRECI